MKKIITLLIYSIGLVTYGYSQDNTSVSNDSLSKSIEAVKKELELFKNIKISGWVQAQYQLADTAGAKNYDGGDFPTSSDNRFTVRRGRLKVTYTNKTSQFVIQINATERGLNLADAFGKIYDPWKKTFAFTAGMMNRPFGYEIQQSSSDREIPERCRFTQMFLPNERDIGAMVTFQPPQGRKLFGLKIDAGLYNGGGIISSGTSTPAGTPSGTTGAGGLTDFDSQKDFMGHVAYYKSLKNDKLKFGVGFSHYNGGFIYQNNKVYKNMEIDTSGNRVWKIEDTITRQFKNKIAPRQYYGVEGLISVKTVLGTTTLRGEYYSGMQTGTDVNTKSPQVAPSATSAMYVRNFSAGYLIFIQRIGKSKHELAARYEWYDPNTKISAKDLNGTNGMKEGEIKFTTYDIGYNIYLTTNVKFLIHYAIPKNEITNIKGYKRDLKDNILTVRMQYKF
jgi:hypothetical protein